MSSQQQRMNENGDAQGYRVPALDRGLDVLELLAARGTALTQSDIARALGRGPSELFRPLNALTRRGYLHRDPLSGAYGLTLRLTELGRRHHPHEGLLRAAERPMRTLSEATSESCHVSVLHRGQLLTLAQIEGSARVRISVSVGSTIAPRHAASGRLLLAFLPEADRTDALQEDASWLSIGAEQRERELGHLAAIRERGFEEARGETVVGVSDLSVLVGAPGSATVAALAIAALPRDHEGWVAAMLPALRECANEITVGAGLAGFGRDEEGGGDAVPGTVF